MTEAINLVLSTIPTGAIVINKNLDIVYSNNKAASFLKHYELPLEINGVSSRIFKAMNGNTLQEQFPGEIYITKKLDGSSSNWTFRMFMSEKPKPLVAVFIMEEPISNNLDMNKVRQQYGLTRREVDILRRVVDGLTNVEIAEALEITEQTVKDHMKRVYMKTGFKNRVDLLCSLLST
jgi:DNA-binding CsgD family transcriptional regulator